MTLLERFSQRSGLTVEGLQRLSQRFILIQLPIETVLAPSFWIGFGPSERSRSGYKPTPSYPVKRDRRSSSKERKYLQTRPFRKRVGNKRERKEDAPGGVGELFVA